MDLFVELHFPPHYWSVPPSAIQVIVGQSATRSAPTDQSPLERCKLSWPLENRIRKQLLPDLLHEVKPLPTPAFSWDSAQEVVSTCDCTWLTAIRALIKCKNDPNRASEEILREQVASAERAGTAKSGSKQASDGAGKTKRADEKKAKEKQQKKKKPKTAASIFTSTIVATAASLFSSTVAVTPPTASSTTPPSTAESQVMSACGVSQYVARRGLSMCNGGVEAAMDLLWSEDTVADLAAEEANGTAADASSLPSGNPGLLTKRTSSSISFASDSGALQSEEDQLLSLLAEHNYLIRLLRFIKSKIHSIHSTCILCEKQLQWAGLNLSVCQSSLCRMSYESMGVGFDIGTAIAAAPMLTDLYISMLASAATAAHLPYANPLTVTGTGRDGVETSFVLSVPAPVAAAAADEEKDKGPMIDYNKLVETIHRLPPVAQMVDDIKAGTFVEKMNQLDPLILPLLRWLFQSCPTYVRELTPAERFSSMPTPYQFVMLMSSRRGSTASSSSSRRAARRASGAGTVGRLATGTPSYAPD